MDNTLRIVRLQQVMGQMSTLFPKDFTVKLSSASTYPRWERYVHRTLATAGAGVDVYFATGNMMVPDESADLEKLQLATLLDQIIQSVLMCTVKNDILDKFESHNELGYGLLTLIRNRYSKISPRELANLVEAAVDARNNSLSDVNASLTLFKNVCMQFNNSPEINQLMGLFYLHMFKTPTAKSKILDAPTPDISLIAVEEALNDFIPVKAGDTFAAVGGSSSSSKSGARKRKPTNLKNVTCYRCQTKGHYASTCTAPAPVAGPNSTATSTDAAFVADTSKQIGFSWAAVLHTSGSEPALHDDRYILDSGSTLHISKDKAHFIDFTPFSGIISGISDTMLEVAGKGSVRFLEPSTGHIMMMHDVFYVPGATQNIVSVKKATQESAFVFTKQDAYYGNPGTTMTKVGTSVDGFLYVFDFIPVIDHSNAVGPTDGSVVGHAALASGKGPASTLKAHQDLGHPSPSVMQTLGYSKPPSGVECASCAAGKTVKEFPAESSTPPASAPLHLIHADVCGPVPIPGLESEKYFLTIVDDFSRWTHVVPLHAKSDAADALKFFIESSEKHFAPKNYKVAYLRTDNGGEFKNGTLDTYCRSKGIVQQFTVPYNSHQNSVLLAAGFTRSISEFGVYSKVVDGHVVLVALYVDDMLILSNSPKLIQATKDMLNSNFKMKDLDVVSTFLGMQVSQSVQGISLNLAKYLSGVLADFGMSDCNSVTTPFASNDVFTPDGSPLSDAEVTQYRSMVGKILFASNTVRPDLAFAASTLSRFIKSPYSNHLASAKHLLRYIKGTLHLGLKFTKQAEFKLVGYCDADWAADKNDRKSITGYVFLLGGTVVTWKSKKQQTVALSSTEAEYMALSDAVKEVLWLKQFLAGIGLKSMSTPMIYEDNEGCKHLAEHPFEHPRTKHIDIRHHFLRDHIANEELKLVSISTDNMMADMLTKNLHRVKFQRFVGMIGMTGV